MSTIYAIRAPNSYARELHDSLLDGEGRFGWSYAPTADLRELTRHVEEDGWQALSDDEKDCFQTFLLELRPGDYVVYINLPTYGKCMAAKVIGEYYWKFTDPDFNHRFGVDPQSVFIFDRTDEAVHPRLQVRLSLPRRWWHITAAKEFESLVVAAHDGRLGKASSPESQMKLLANELTPILRVMSEAIHRTYPRKSLEHLLQRVFERVPGVTAVEPKRGRADKGADLLVRLEREHPITGVVTEEICLVQVKSFEGEHWDSGAVDDLQRAFEVYPEATEGLIVSTASAAGETLEQAMNELTDKCGKPVQLLLGERLAAFFVRFGWDLLHPASQ